ncbi:MAG: GntR family transcriptional regulator [Acidobacteria bacterium]|nr:GntR family transcriptional regulator [Acidobacteriota bacterium]
MNRTSGIPLYVQIREELRSELARLEPGQAIAVETELEKTFGASRITVRRAVEELVAEGLLVRQQGRGTFVQSPRLTHELSRITSWTEQLKILGFSPKTAHRRIRQESASPHVAEILRLHAGEQVIRLERVRLAGREPISYMINYLPARLVPEFCAHKRLRESLYEFIEQEYGLRPEMAVDTVSTRPASEEEANALRVPRKLPVLRVQRVSYLEDGTPLELAIVASRGDRYQYEVTLHGRPGSVAAAARHTERVGLMARKGN